MTNESFFFLSSLSPEFFGARKCVIEIIMLVDLIMMINIQKNKKMKKSDDARSSLAANLRLRMNVYFCVRGKFIIFCFRFGRQEILEDKVNREVLLVRCVFVAEIAKQNEINVLALCCH
jgi:hypothetical protein